MQAFRLDEREKDDGKRFRIVLSSVVDKRLMYSELTGHGTATEASSKSLYPTGKANI